MADDEESEYESTSDEEESDETASEAEREQEQENVEYATNKDRSESFQPPTTSATGPYPNHQNGHQDHKPSVEEKDVGETVSRQATTQRQRKMTQARKQNLKSLMLNKARADLKVEAEHKAEEKKRILSSRIQPLGDLHCMDECELRELCTQLSNKIDVVDEQRYDFEAKVKKNDLEIDDLNQRIYDLRGKFKRPPLKRVHFTADQMLRALLGSKHKASMDLRSNLKSVKKEELKKEETKDWRDSVEAKQGMSGKKAMFEQASQQESQEGAQEEESE